MKKRRLILEDGSVFEGIGFGSDNYRVGELIFTTGIGGYQEILSDLSYYGQIVMPTYPLMGNCGINRDDHESISPKLFGFVVKEYCEEPSNWRSSMTLDEFMKLNDIPGISDVDTRMITRKIRDHGVMKAIMADMDSDVDEIVKMLQSSELPSDGVQKVSTQRPFPIPSRGAKAIMLDIGTKFAVIRELNLRGVDLIVVPYDYSAKEILALRPDGVIVSGGPGAPEEIPETIATCKQLLGHVAMLGIGLGHEVIACACGAKVKKMKVGHHGNSSPIRNLKTNKIEFTAQNHGYEIDEASLAGTGLQVSYRALNDNSIEGLIHEDYALKTFSFEPEASPGADDCTYVFDDFVELMNKGGIQ